MDAGLGRFRDCPRLFHTVSRTAFPFVWFVWFVVNTGFSIPLLEAG